VGAEVAALLAARHGERLRKGKELALVAEVRLGGRRLAVAFPQTWMNDSGRSVGSLVRRHEVGIERLVVVHDELDLPLGRVKVKVGGGLAGHNGLKSLKRELGGPDFQRVRVGVGRPDSTDPEIVSGYVLGRFSEPADDVRALVAAAADEIERVVTSSG